MNLFSRLFQRTTDRPQPRRTPAPKPASRFRPRLVHLEGRDVPSTLLVTTTADSVTNITPGMLRYDINHAQPGDTIAFSPTLANSPNYSDHIIQLRSQLTISRSLTIQGPGADKMAISGANQWRVFEVNSHVNAAISGLTIENGRDNPNGGNSYAGQGDGILNLGTLTLSDCTVTQNLGGGIANYGTLTVSRCVVSLNLTNPGWGIYNSNGATATVSNSIFISNISNLSRDIYNSTNVHFTDGGGNTFS